MSLPIELVDEILYLLPVKYLLRCRCVSKEWCSLIDSTVFVKKHFKRTIECNPDSGVVISGDRKIFLTDFESLRDHDVGVSEISDACVSGVILVGVANGLACLCKGNMKEFVLCNSSTRKCRAIPCVMSLCCGFGYDHVNDDYKVVKIVECEDCIMVTVYSLKSNSWKRLEDIGSNVRFIPHWGEFVDGALHWKAIKLSMNPLCIILSFDLGLEQFKEVPFPDVNGMCVCLARVGGSLCITDTYKDSRTDVWLMNNHGAENPWCKAFSVEHPGAFETFNLVVRPVAFSNSRKDVLFEVDRTTLLWYDLEKMTAKNVRIHGIPVKFNAHLYTESLLQVTESKQLQKPAEDKKEKKQQKERNAPEMGDK